MDKNYTNFEIISAVNYFLNKKIENKTNEKKEILLPKDTEQIILQAEKFLNK